MFKVFVDYLYPLVNLLKYIHLAFQISASWALSAPHYSTTSLEAIIDDNRWAFCNILSKKLTVITTGYN